MVFVPSGSANQRFLKLLIQSSSCANRNTSRYLTVDDGKVFFAAEMQVFLEANAVRDSAYRRAEVNDKRVSLRRPVQE